MTESSSLTTGGWQVFVASHVELMLKSIAHGAYAMACALQMVGGDHRTPGSVWAASSATLVFPICGIKPYVT